ncbi:hypothetical protein [Corynebacterium liangguodongii]|uniref:Uncharacterized protein n=1 Tax=Corynebacterium liangguodongii TaxID=2079535 RepID=A0A2S0WFC2_9CORY|nr:hypothetical protein [Corynebacterium liangguodongii]AWB84456.1 hypothetical protein C3E79_08150 [Corynebacterium liangguodongii]PWB99945.1 hypothetical protein DF219_04745 [Corynebacterium liangguodongii]
MIWQGSSLRAGHTTLAESGDEMLVYGTQRLRVDASDPADIRAVGGGGERYRLSKAGLTVARYRADCDGRTYSLRRAGGGSRREVIDAAGEIVARTRGRHDGDLELDPTGELDVDLVFMSWGLTFIDSPSRRTMI